MENKPESEQVKEKKEVILVEIPTEIGLAFQTPEGIKNPNEYFAWMGNLLLEIKEKLMSK